MKKIQKELIGIGKEVTDILKNIKEIKAIAFHGAVAEGFADKYSDIDIVFFCDKIPIKKVKNIFKEFQDFRMSRKMGDEIIFVLCYKKRYIGLHFFTISSIEKYIKTMQTRGYYDFRKDSIFVGRVLNTKCIYDPKNLIKKWKKKSRKILKKYLPEAIKFFIPFLKDQSELSIIIKRKNWLFENLRIAQFIEWFLVCLYALNGEPYYISKWAFKKIPTFKYKPKNCVKKLEQISLLGNDPKDLKKKINIFKDLIKDMEPLITN